MPQNFIDFAKCVYPYLVLSTFHQHYYRVLEAFSQGKVRRLIVTMPPQHGKSVGASVLLPAYMLGLNPDLRVAIASYSGSLAARFNRRVQRIIDSPEYAEIFPGTTIKSSGGKGNYIRTAEQVEIIGHRGEVLAVGREGALTGNQVDIFILDDLYKDAMEGNSPVVRENCWEWYTSVVKTRMHNDSAELIVFTRWHEEDLIGTIASKEDVVELKEWNQIESLKPEQWLLLNFEALKESAPTEIDCREEGEPLWAERHSARLLAGKRKLDVLRFNCMYQGRPSSKEGVLYGGAWRTYDTLPGELMRLGNYTDTADVGDDYLCSVCYGVGRDGAIYVTDMVYSREGMEVTEGLVAQMLNRNMTRVALVESNNGGRGFARAVAKLTPLTKIEWFHQGANKEARIVSNSSTVMRHVVMPYDWAGRWSDFHAHVSTYRRLYNSNRWHDAPDVLTGIVEREVLEAAGKRIKAFGFMG